MATDAKALAEKAGPDALGPAPLAQRSVHAAGDVILDKYRLERPLGEGGQATVWEAQNLALDALVALKLVHPDASDPTQAERLLREARAVARLRHPGVVRVFDVAQTSDGAWFIVMELLDGENLAERLAAEGRIAGVEAVRLLLPIAEALVAAHTAGIVHRDVKPDNVVLARVGGHVEPKLLDFGIAKLPRAQDWRRTTAKGSLMGTPGYLSPEQAACESDIDHRSDVWSFAAMIYECVTGQLPFDGETDAELFENIARSEPRSILSLSAGDAELWRLLERGLAKSRDERWASMREFGTELARWLLAQGVRDDARGAALEARWLDAAPAVDEGRAVPSAGRKTPAAVSFTRAGPDGAPVSRRFAEPRARRAALLSVAVLGAAIGIALLGAVRPRDAASTAPVVVAQARVVAAASPSPRGPVVVPLEPVVQVPSAAASSSPPVASVASSAAASSPRGVASVTSHAEPKQHLGSGAGNVVVPSPAPASSATPDGLKLLNPY